MPEKVFIYCLKDPTTGDVRYIGKTDNVKKRLRAHLTSSSKERNRLGNWLRSLSEPPVLVVLHEVAENESWAEEERRYISCARALGVDLVNATDGGEGAPGRVVTSETRAVMRGSHLGVSNGPHSPATRAAMSVASRGIPKSPKHCAAISAAKRGVPLTPAQQSANAARKGVPCAAISAAWTPERRAAQGAANSARLTGVPWTEARRAARKGVPWSATRRAAYERRWGAK